MFCLQLHFSLDFSTSVYSAQVLFYSASWKLFLSVSASFYLASGSCQVSPGTKVGIIFLFLYLSSLRAKGVPYHCCYKLPYVYDTSGSCGSRVWAGASLVAQWLRICLPMQGTWVRALVWEDATCHGANGPVSHNYWACASGACAPQQERPWQWEARAPRWRVAPACHN